jgi:SPP1 family predicted phage head-tail adaptor
MDIGALRHQVTLQGPGALVADGDGGYTQTPATVGTVWASIQPATARDLERIVANVEQANASHLVTIRYRDDVNTTTQVLYGTRVLKVTGMQNPDERNISLILICTEIVS